MRESTRESRGTIYTNTELAPRTVALIVERIAQPMYSISRISWSTVGGGMIIHINGMPGVGKLTVAQILAQKLPARLIDNHRLIDAATTCCEHGSPTYVRVLEKITNIVFDELRMLPPGEIIIFTNALAGECPEDIVRFESCRELAKSRNEEFLAVLLTCSVESNLKRVSDPSRALKGKLVREERLLELLEQYSIYHPDTERHKIEIDTSDLDPAESAKIIQEAAESLRGRE